MAQVRSTQPMPAIETITPAAPSSLDYAVRAPRREAPPHPFSWLDFGAVLGMVAVWRGATWFFALLASYTAVNVFPPATASGFFTRVLLQGDALWYVWIGQQGYDTAALGQQVTGILPLYPALLRFTSLIVPSWIVSAALVSHLALLAALAYLFMLVRYDGPRSLALRTVAVALLWPAAPFLGSVAPQSLLLLTLTAALYHARRDEWGRVALWAGLAGLTQGLGLVLAPALTIAWFTRNRQALYPHQKLRPRPNGQTVLLAIIAAPATFAAWLLVLTRITGSPLAYFQGQMALRAGSLGNPLGLQTLLDWHAIVTRTAPLIRGYPVSALPFPDAHIPAAIDAGALLLAAGCGIWLIRHAQRAHGGLLLITVIAGFLFGGFPGAARLLLPLAPLHLTLGRWSRGPVAGYLAAMFGLLLLALTLFLYVNGFWAG